MIETVATCPWCATVPQNYCEETKEWNVPASKPGSSHVVPPSVVVHLTVRKSAVTAANVAATAYPMFCASASPSPSESNIGLE